MNSFSYVFRLKAKNPKQFVQHLDVWREASGIVAT